MTTFNPNAATVYADGPFTAPTQPSKPMIRQLLTQYEAAIGAYATGAGSTAKTTRALLYADLAHAAGAIAWVFQDSTPAYNGIYIKSGASGSGSWARILPLPYSFVAGADTGAGTPNAIQITTNIPVSDGMIVAFVLHEATTGSPVTFSVNGGAPLTAKSNRGNNASALGAGQDVWFRVRESDSTARMISDQDVAALVAQAETARDVAVAAAGANVSAISTRAAAEAFDFPPEADYVRTAGYAEAGDYGCAVYARYPTPPILGFQDLNGDYWQLRENEILPEQAGCVSNDSSKASANKAAFQNAADTGLLIRVPSRMYYSDPGIVIEEGGVKGNGRSKSRIIIGDTTSAHLFEVNSQSPLIFEDMDYTATNLAKTAGAAIYLTSATGANIHTRIVGNTFAQFPFPIWAHRALSYNIFDNVFSQYDVGVIIENEDHPDGGDSSITNNIFVTLREDTPNRLGILQYNSGGLKLIGNKINGGRLGYQMNAKGSVDMPAQSTSILIIQGNSIENQSVGNISLERSPSADPSIVFLHAIINANHLNCAWSDEVARNITVGSDLNLKWANISNNTIQLSTIAGSTGATIAALDQGIILGNVIDSAGSGHVGIEMGSNVYATLGPNRYGPGIATPYTAATPSNVTVVGGG